MNNFIIDSVIKDDYDDLLNMCSLISEYKKTEFNAPASIEKIEAWEKDNNCELPYQYKSWLALTSEARVAGGYVEFSWPEIGRYEQDDDVIIIGSIMGDGENVLISRATGNVFSSFEDDDNEYEDFNDLLINIILYLEEYAEEFLGADWIKVYEERFGDA